MFIQETSIIYSSTAQMQEICQPLFLSTEITYFEYVRLYIDGYMIKLDTEENVLPYILSNNLYLKPADFKEFKPYLFMSSYLSDSNDNVHVDVICEYRNYFSLDNFFFLMKTKSKYIEVFVFGSQANNNKIINFYMNNIDKLDQFSLYFFDKAKSLIAEAAREKFFVKEWQHSFCDKACQSNEEKTEVLCEPAYIYFSGFNNKEIALSYKQFNCIVEYLKGNSAKHIANNLNISNRTVETHILQVKKKLQCTNKGQLLKKWVENGYGAFVNYG